MKPSRATFHMVTSGAAGWPSSQIAYRAIAISMARVQLKVTSCNTGAGDCLRPLSEVQHWKTLQRASLTNHRVPAGVSFSTARSYCQWARALGHCTNSHPLGAALGGAQSLRRLGADFDGDLAGVVVVGDVRAGARGPAALFG